MEPTRPLPILEAGIRKGVSLSSSPDSSYFRNHLDRLYLLALVLAGDELMAEECFLAAFDSCVEEHRVFKESAPSWSRRSVIKNAIRIVLPSPGNSYPQPLVGERNGLNADQDASLEYVQNLPPFDRFVFVMSVLECYSDHECAALLGCSWTDILPARIRAFQQISRPEKTYLVHRSASPTYVVDADWLECR